MTKSFNYSRQKGVALFISLIFLILISLLSLSSMQSSITEQNISANFQHRVEATELSQAVIDATISDNSNFKVIGGPGYTFCYNRSTDSNGNSCNDTSTYDLDTEFNNDTRFTDHIAGEVQFMGEHPPPRNFGYELPGFSVGLFEIEGTYDDTANGYGRSNTKQGYIITIAKPNI